MKTYNLKSISISILIIFIILKFFNTPYNIYSILLSKYEDRMIQTYGFCENESWGFYNHVVNKFDLQNKEVKIINDEGHVTLENLTNLKIKNKDAKYVMILNYQSKNKESIYDSKYSFVQKYKIKFRFNNCYLLVRND